jgi:D-glycero-alpha-D-manno-heptose 1-phosphate guanylyltransferase
MAMREALQDMDVVILAGGRGTRLDSIPGDLPKPLRPINGRPFLAYLIDQVRNAGARRVLLAIGYRAEAFAGFVEETGRTGLQVETSVESAPLGTGGALRASLPRLRTDDVLVLNGDSYADIDPASLAAEHVRRKARATILLTEVSDAGRYGRVDVDGEGAVVRFSEKGAGGPGLINAGLYVFRRETLAEIPEGKPASLERDTLPSLIGRSFFAKSGRFRFTDIGTPESYAAAPAFFREMRPA